MNLIYLSILPLLFTFTNAHQVPAKDHTKRNYFAIELDIDTKLIDVIETNPSWTYEHEARGNPNHFVFSESKDLEHSSSVKGKRSTSGVKTIHHLPLKTLQKRLPIPEPPIDSSMKPIFDAKEQFEIQDPEFQRQWHLINPSFPGNDINVTGVWSKGITGKNVVAAIIDDGLDYESEDLKDNFNEAGSWDFNNNRKLPKPTLADDYHGTRCAGEIAAVKNDVCGVGVAYDSQVSGIRILSGQITSEDEAASLVYGLETNDIYSCSWGPPDDGKAMQAPDDLVKNALIRGVTEGRDGKGAVYVFASGNGAHHGDNCNYDGYTNSIYSITVGAIDHRGLRPPYSEGCSAVLVVTYSSGSGEYIRSTDINDKCTDHHGGTSAAAPLAAGIYSLVLSANANLTWRDVQYLTIHSSVTVNEDDGNYQEAALNKYSHAYGYGKLDAYKIVELAQTWINVNEQIEQRSETIEPNQLVKFGEDYEHEFEIKDLNDFKNLEHVRLNLNMDTEVRGQVTVDLISPSGIVSNLGAVRSLDRSNDGFQDWKFMSVAHWGDENFTGTWKLKVANHLETNKVLLKNFYIDFFGQKIENVQNEPSKDTKVSSSTNSESITSILSTLPSSSSTLNSFIQSTSPYPTSTSEASDVPSNDDNKGGIPRPVNTHYGEYFFGFIIVGFFILLLYFSLASKRLAKRRQQYEFDIIRPEDTDDDSEFDIESRIISNEHEDIEDDGDDIFGDHNHDNRLHTRDSFDIQTDDEINDDNEEIARNDSENDAKK
ncbi:hypothetical protein WICMUC_000047 [Wickerhamomyces mucosus]|uniref:P/Homo B domain-containing protein n=1 Tax=Wickerhamomyces mucosus TaxID=1378264 RepID=A0A9P8Q131_9ASCO|nr:hypothetical protein WICMUC_000047 [Wickerhamomyces mucosus]